MEDQQRRIGSELHDNLCQNLAGIAALSAALERSLTADQHRVAQAGLREITQLLNGAVGDARNIARGLFATDLAHSSLRAELGRLRDDAERRFRVTCTTACDEPYIPLTCEAELHLLRIAQEAVSNAIVHGRARNIGLALLQTTTQTTLSITDNGTGFSGESHPQGLGLRSMRYRAALIGATIDIKHRADRGIEVICTLAHPHGPNKNKGTPSWPPES